MTLPLKDGALFVSSSFLDTLTCPRYSQYYKINARVSGQEGAGLRFGTHLHSALSLASRLKEYQLTKSEIDSRVSQLLEEEFANKPNDEADWRNLNWAMEIYQQHAKSFEFESFDLMRYKEAKSCKNCSGLGFKIVTDPCLWCNGTGKTSIMSEVSFVVKLFDYPLLNKDWKLQEQLKSSFLPIYYHGFIDLLVSQNNLIFVFDWKSTSKLGQSYWEDKTAIAQPKGYCWAIQELLGVKTHGYIIRAIRTLEPPIYVTNGTTSKKGEYKKISDWWNESLVEQRFYLGEGELEEWKNNAIGQVEEFLWHYAKGFFPQSKSLCSGKYGKCQYFEVCNTFPVSDRLILLNSEMFKNKETNVKLIQ